MSDPLAQSDALRMLLRKVATRKETLTYHQAAEAIGLHPPHVIHSISLLLEALMAEDAELGHPFLAALVISPARENVPALGFFEAAARFGRFEGDPFSAEAIAWHSAERELAMAFHADA